MMRPNPEAVSGSAAAPSPVAGSVPGEDDSAARASVMNCEVERRGAVQRECVEWQEDCLPSRGETLQNV